MRDPLDPRRWPGPKRRTLIYAMMQSLCRIIVTVFFGFKAYDLHNIPRTGGFLLTPNHQSYFDPVLAGIMLHRPIGFFANAYLFKNPLFGWLLRNLSAWPVERGKGDRGAVVTAIEKLKAGYAVNLFPEGTRTPDGKIQPLERGVALIIRKAGVPIVPVAIDGGYDAWPRTRKLPRLHPVHVMYGKPIDPTGMDSHELLATLERELKAVHARLIAKRETW